MIIQMPLDYDKYIYHFSTSEKTLLYILPSLKLKLASFLETNDPKENKTFGFWSIFENCANSNIPEIKKKFKQYLINNCKLTCFSSDYTIDCNGNDFYTEGFKHPTMWAHYGENYKGVCLVFYQKFIKEFVDNNISKENYLFDRVKYSSILSFPAIEETELNKNEDLYFKNFLIKNANDFFFRKHFHWKSEDEIRIVHIGNENFFSIENSLAGVITGPEFDPNLLELLKKLMPRNTWIEKLMISEGSLSSFVYWINE